MRLQMLEMSLPAGAGGLQCVALWDLESCPLPAPVLEYGLGPAVIRELQQRFGASQNHWVHRYILIALDEACHEHTSHVARIVLLAKDRLYASPPYGRHVERQV